MSTVVGHMCRRGMRLQAPDGRELPVRKPTRWASSAPEVLRRPEARCSNEGRRPGDPGWHDHTIPEGRLPGGFLRAQAAATYPPTLCISILRGIAAQRAREGHPLPKVARTRLDEGRAVYSFAAERHTGHLVHVHESTGKSVGELADRAAWAVEAQAAQDEHPGVGRTIDPVLAQASATTATQNPCQVGTYY